MANTANFCITCFCDEEEVIAALASATGVDLRKISDDLAGGGIDKVMCLESYGAVHYAGEINVPLLIATFKAAPFGFPDMAVMVISDDDGFSGVVLREEKRGA